MDVDFDGWSAFGMLNLTTTGTLTVAGAIDANNDLDLDGTDVDVDATNDISLDAGAASNFTTSAGALTLEGAGGVTVTSTGGTLALNGTGQTVDLDAANLDVDATTITIDATNTTFTGNVKGPKATADDEFVTYEQLDSLASVAPFNETYRLFKNTGGTPQTVSDGSTTGLELSGFGSNIYTEVSAQAAAQTLQLPFSVQASAQGGGLQVIALSDPGVYETQLTVEVDPNAGANPDIYVLVELYNYDALQGNGLPTTRVLAADAQVVHDAATFGGQVSAHFNMSMTFIADNSDEEVYVKITPTGGDVDIVTFGFSVARKGEN